MKKEAQMGSKITLSREAAAVLLKDARCDFANAVQELYGCDDQSQQATIDATVELIGRLADTVEKRWPRETHHGITDDQWFVEFEFSPGLLAWLEKRRSDQVGYIGDLDRGESRGVEPGYHAEQVYLLHVLNDVVGERDAVTV